MAPKFDANFGLMSVLSCCLTMPDLGKELNSYTGVLELTFTNLLL